MLLTATQLDIGRLQSKCAQLESALAARDQELALADAKYRKYAEKAKEVIKNLDPRILSGKITKPLRLFISLRHSLNSGNGYFVFQIPFRIWIKMQRMIRSNCWQRHAHRWVHSKNV